MALLFVDYLPNDGQKRPKHIGGLCHTCILLYLILAQSEYIWRLVLLEGTRIILDTFEHTYHILLVWERQILYTVSNYEHNLRNIKNYNTNISSVHVKNFPSSRTARVTAVSGVVLPCIKPIAEPSVCRQLD
jgi:hypothetical protein